MALTKLGLKSNNMNNLSGGPSMPAYLDARLRTGQSLLVSYNL